MKLKILSTPAGQVLAEKVCKQLGKELKPVDHKRFADGEYLPQVGVNIRKSHVVLICPVSPPCNINLMDTMILCDAIKRANPKRFSLVIPYLGYNRQDRKDRPRVPVTAKLATDIIALREPDNILLFDVHSEPTQAYFPISIKVDHLYGSIVAVKRIKKLVKAPFVIGGPDKGAGPRAAVYARLMGQDSFVMFDKHRGKAGKIDPKQSKVIGDVRGMEVILIDDMLDTGGTANQAAKTALDNGAKGVYFFSTHGLLSGEAAANLNNGPMKKILITDSIDHSGRDLGSKIEVLSIAPLLAQAITCIHKDKSISKLINS